MSAAFCPSYVISSLTPAAGTGTIDMVAPQAMRTVWLALLCLIGLAATVVVKFGVSSNDLPKALPSATAKALPGAALTDATAPLAENLMARTRLQNSSTTKTDKLEVSNEAALEVKPVEAIAIELSRAEPKQLSKTPARIVARHWHDPLDGRRAAAQSTAKGKLSKRAQSAEASIATSTGMTIGER